MSQNTDPPKPYVVQNSGQWLGNDGSWSTFYVHVGTPAQTFHVLPNFDGQTLYVPRDADCQRLDTNDCGRQRGVEVFNSLPSLGFQSNMSSSWKELGNYKLTLGDNLGLTGTVLYGYDTCGPGPSRSSSAINLNNVTVGAYAAPDVWLGQLGLSMSPININDTDQPSSFLSRMKESGYIPSLSFGYQAGAPYRSTKVPGNLILGGYDRSLQANRTLTFTSTQEMTVGVQGISTQFSNGTTRSLSTVGILSTLTTNAAEMWLPRPVCDVFESVFNLTYSSDADRYYLNETAHAQLQRTNPTISFIIGKSISGGDAISINITYAALDLQASYPIFGQATNYFPLRRAANQSQYALGRVFLQEVYLSVDRERGVFNLSQAAFNSTQLPANIVTIEPVNRSSILVSTPGQPQSVALSAGAIAGIAIGATIFVLALLVLSWWFFRRQRHAKVDREPTQAGPMDERKDAGQFAPETVEYKPPAYQTTELELEGRIVPEMYAPLTGIEAPNVTNLHSQIVEADASSPIYELPSPHEHGLRTGQ